MVNTGREFSISTHTLLKIVLIGLALFFAWTIRDILVLLLIAVTFASAMDPLVDMLHLKKIPRAVSVLSVYILAIAVVGVVAYLVIPPVLTEFQLLTSNSSELTAELERKLSASPTLSQLNIGPSITRSIQSLGSGVGHASDNLFQTTLGVFSGFIQVITVLVVSFYLVAEKNGMKNFVHTLVPEENQAKILHIVHRIQHKVGLWMIGQFIISGTIFVMVFAMLTALGVKYALVLALLAAVLEFIPYIGPIMFAVPGILVAFVQDPALAILVGILYIIIQKIEAYVLVPKIMQRTVGLSPLVILVAILVGLKVAGILGVLLAVPVAASAHVIIKEWKKPEPAVEIA